MPRSEARIDQKIRTAGSLYMLILVICLVATGLSIERLGSGDAFMGTLLGVGGLVGVAWSMIMRYAPNGIYNPSRIHKREKAR